MIARGTSRPEDGGARTCACAARASRRVASDRRATAGTARARRTAPRSQPARRSPTALWSATRGEQAAFPRPSWTPSQQARPRHAPQAPILIDPRLSRQPEPPAIAAARVDADLWVKSGIHAELPASACDAPGEAIAARHRLVRVYQYLDDPDRVPEGPGTCTVLAVVAARPTIGDAEERFRARVHDHHRARPLVLVVLLLLVVEQGKRMTSRALHSSSSAGPSSSSVFAAARNQPHPPASRRTAQVGRWRIEEGPVPDMCPLRSPASTGGARHLIRHVTDATPRRRLDEPASCSCIGREEEPRSSGAPPDAAGQTSQGRGSGTGVASMIVAPPSLKEEIPSSACARTASVLSAALRQKQQQQPACWDGVPLRNPL